MNHIYNVFPETVVDGNSRSLEALYLVSYVNALAVQSSLILIISFSPVVGDPAGLLNNNAPAWVVTTNISQVLTSIAEPVLVVYDVADTTRG